MARWQSCNVLDAGAETRRVWQFNAGDSFSLTREQATRAGEQISPKLVAKSWNSLWQKRLNVAWLPPEHVFIRVAQFPQSTPDETRAMVELQLEKLSPLPVTQAVWSMHIMPQTADNMQTVIVVVAARSIVEEFLGKLESEGYLADRLELPLIDQLEATSIHEDGAYIYPLSQGLGNTAVVAWWYGGILRNVDLLTMAAEGDRGASLRDQLMQMAWAGELEGWLTAPPRWHVIADENDATWLTPLREGLDPSIAIIPPVSPAEIAARTARRAAESPEGSTLIPPEYSIRYRQQFVDRLWLRGLGAVVALYIVAVLVYFVALGFLNYRTKGVEAQAKSLAPAYTNSMQLNAQLAILKERQELKFAALDCWLAVAEHLPPNVTLESLTLSGGKTLRLSGTAPPDQVAEVINFCDKLRKTIVRGQPLFETRGNEPPRITGNRWSYDLDLKRTADT